MKSIKYNSTKNLYQNNPSKNIIHKFIIKGKKDTYNLTDTIGKGTFGKVKLAYSIKNPTIKYACKILEKSNIKEDDDLKRCIREMSILLQMDHPNVIKTYEIISDSMRYYIIMEYCSQGELFNHIVKENRFSEEKSAFFFYQIISGLEYIHSKNICHRDLKPENLLINSEEEIKIIDFGLSNYKIKEKNYLLKTPCGSPCYASPEMILGKNYDGFGIDIWSTGIILFAMLCGYLPFEEGEGVKKNEVLFKNIVKCKIDYPAKFVGKNARNLLQKIIVVNPKERITIKEIKKHPFFLMGKDIYLKRYGIIRNKTIENFKGSFSLRHSLNLNLNLNDKEIFSNTKHNRSNKIINVNKKLNNKILDNNILNMEEKKNPINKHNTFNNYRSYYMNTNYDKCSNVNSKEKNLKDLLITSINNGEENKFDKKYYNLKGINVDSNHKKFRKNLNNINKTIRTNFSGRNKKITNYNLSNFNTLEGKSYNYNTNRKRKIPLKMKAFQKSIKELNLKNNEPLYNISTPKNIETIFNNYYLTNHNNTEGKNHNIDISKKYTKTETNLIQTKTNNVSKNKNKMNLNLCDSSSKYINTIVNTNQYNSSKMRSINKTSARKNKIKFSKTSLNNEIQQNNRNNGTKRINKSTKSLKMKYISNLDKNDFSDYSENKNDKYSIKVNQFSKYIKTIYNTNRGNDFKSNNFNSINKKIYSYFNNFYNNIKSKQNHINQNKYTITIPKYINEYQIKNMLIENEKNEKEPLNLNNIHSSNNSSINQRKKSNNKISIKHTLFNNKNINNRIGNLDTQINFNSPKTKINYNLTLSNQENSKRSNNYDANKNLSKRSSYHTSRAKKQNEPSSKKSKNNKQKSINNHSKNKFESKNLEIPTEICFNSNNKEYKTIPKNIQTNTNDINNNKIVINLNILKPKIFVDKYKGNMNKRNKNYSSNYRNNINMNQKYNKSKNDNFKRENQFSFVETFLNNMIHNKLNPNGKKH